MPGLKSHFVKHGQINPVDFGDGQQLRKPRDQPLFKVQLELRTAILQYRGVCPDSLERWSPTLERAIVIKDSECCSTHRRARIHRAPPDEFPQLDAEETPGWYRRLEWPQAIVAAQCPGATESLSVIR